MTSLSHLRTTSIPTRTAPAALILTALGVASLTAMLCAATGAEAPAPPSRPPLPEPRTPVWGEIFDLPRTPDRNLGVGCLRPQEVMPDAGADWWSRAVVPLFDRPEPRGADPTLWLARGWVVAADGSEPRPLSPRGMVEIGYASAANLVFEIRPSGWFQVEYTVSGEAVAHRGWTHPSYLALGELSLTVETWEAFLLRESETESLSPLYFRTREVPHALRRGPGTDTERLTWIGADHALDPLEIRGDWMRVRVEQPSGYCMGRDQWSGRRDEGWIRWRGPNKGPWLWFYSRGC